MFAVTELDPSPHWPNIGSINPTVYVAGPALAQHWVNVSFILGGSLYANGQRGHE